MTIIIIFNVFPSPFKQNFEVRHTDLNTNPNIANYGSWVMC